MSRTIKPSAWLKHLESVDQLPEFISMGGSCIRVVRSANVATHEDLVENLDSYAERHGYLYLAVSHATCDKLHMPHMVLKSLVQELRLRETLVRITQRVWHEAGYRTTGVTLADVRNEHRDEDLVSLRSAFRDGSRRLLANTGMLGHEFSAITRSLLRAITESQGQGDEAVGLLERALSQTATAREITELGLLRKIQRANATPTLWNLFGLHRLAGWPGVLLHLDLRWASDPLSVAPHTTRPPALTAVRDVYQWTRDLIDITPELRSSFICAEFGESFLDPFNRRSIWLYDALRLRIVDDAAPSHGANPSAPLVDLDIWGGAA